MSNYYVYVYIDPRNFEEFYYGKGKESRKEAHLFDTEDSPKTKRITEIRLTGEKPIVRIIARGLTEDQALLIEATLLWRLGKFTTNRTAGHFSDLFRPRDTMHRELPGFDFENRLYYFNVGEGKGECRTWADCRRYHFIAAGHGVKWRNAILKFRPNDVFAAYLKNRGFVGIGRIVEGARIARDVYVGGKSVTSLCPIMSHDIDSVDLAEYVARVEWIRDVPAEQARWSRKSDLFTTTHVRASLDNQPETVSYLEREFDVIFKEVLQ